MRHSYKASNFNEGIQRKVPDLFTQPVEETRMASKSQIKDNQISAHSGKIRTTHLSFKLEQMFLNSSKGFNRSIKLMLAKVLKTS